MTISSFSQLSFSLSQMSVPVVQDPLLREAILDALRVDRPIISIISSTDNNGNLLRNSAVVTRRRALHVLSLVIDHGSSSSTSSGEDPSSKRVWAIWNQYVASFEALEMEMEQHLVNQVWPTLRQLVNVAAQNDNLVSQSSQAHAYPPPLTWTWIGAIVSRLCALKIQSCANWRSIVSFTETWVSTVPLYHYQKYLVAIP
jgi:hypothetical protein